MIADSPNLHCGVNKPRESPLRIDQCIRTISALLIQGLHYSFPANGRYITDIHDPDFPEQYQRLLERLDYLTKPGTKASGQRNSGYSGFDLL